MKQTFTINKETGQLPFMVFFQSKGGWPVFTLFLTLADAEKCVDHLRHLGLKPVLYLDLSDADVEGE